MGIRLFLCYFNRIYQFLASCVFELQLTKKHIVLTPQISKLQDLSYNLHVLLTFVRTSYSSPRLYVCIGISEHRYIINAKMNNIIVPLLYNRYKKTTFNLYMTYLS